MVVARAFEQAYPLLAHDDGTHVVVRKDLLPVGEVRLHRHDAERARLRDEPAHYVVLDKPRQLRVRAPPVDLVLKEAVHEGGGGVVLCTVSCFREEVPLFAHTLQHARCLFSRFAYPCGNDLHRLKCAGQGEIIARLLLGEKPF